MWINRNDRRLYILALHAFALLSWSNIGLGLGWPGVDMKGVSCYQVPNNLGPFDYSNSTHRKKYLKMVEDHHFTRETEQLKGYFIGDLNYTLRTFPNHHRALYAVYRYATMNSREKKAPLVSPPECYFQRAIAFKPRDFVIRTLYGRYLLKKKHLDMAKTEFEKALKIKPQYKSAQYYLGITLFKQGKMSEAQDQAKILIKEGHKGQRLRKMLEDAGYPVVPE